MSPRLLLPFLAGLGVTVSTPSVALEPITAPSGLFRGDWSDSVPIEMPPAPNGTVPQVAIVASHRTPDSVVGSGFDLAGLSSITRHSEGGGVPNVTVSSQFRLDGQDLVRVSNNGVAWYEPEKYSGARLDYDDGTNTWTVRRDGWTWTYGSGSDSSLNATLHLHGTPFTAYQTVGGVTCDDHDAKCNTAAWYLSRTTDPWGNEIEYRYQVPAMPGALSHYDRAMTKRHLIDEISYAEGNVVVSFTYANRPDPRLYSGHGTPTFLTKRLSTIAVRSFGVLYSRYELEYKDEYGPDCSGAAVEDPDDALGVLVDGQAPIQTLLRRITQTGNPTGANPQRELRCFETHHEAESNAGRWGSDTDASDLTNVITGPEAGQVTGDPYNTGIQPIAANLNGDGLPDLLLAVHNCSMTTYSYPSGAPDSVLPDCDVYTKAYINTGDASQRFTADDPVAQSWSLLGPPISEDAQIGYGYVDIDLDGILDYLVESNGAIRLAQVDPRTGEIAWRPAITEDPAEVKLLERATFADVNGDGWPDMIVRPHNSTETTVWFRNRGEAPWFELSNPLDMTLPLEEATAHQPDEWTLAIATCPDDDHEPSMTFGKTSNQARFADVNGDGLVDLVYAVYACWETFADPDALPPAPEMERPVPNSAEYSRIFWGTGTGDWVDSGLSAGKPFAIDVPTFEWEAGDDPYYRVRGYESPAFMHAFANHFAVMDLDGNGLAELLNVGGSGGGVFGPGRGVGGVWFRGLVEGFGFSTSNTAEDLELDLGTLSGGAPIHASAIADFTGDGFPDILEFFIDPNESEPPHGTYFHNVGWRVAFRQSQQEVSQGRVTSSTNAWGGETLLQWRFSADPAQDYDNPELPMNVEVLASENGANGRIHYRYGAGGHRQGAFVGFGKAEKLNARGGLEQYGFATAPTISGSPVYGTRRRTDGSLEAGHVFVHGRRTVEHGFGYDEEAPFFNPLIRRCDFEFDFGHQRSVTQLVEDCLAGQLNWEPEPDPEPIGGEIILIPVDETLDLPTADAFMTSLGWERYPLDDTLRSLANRVWDEEVSTNGLILPGQYNATLANAQFVIGGAWSTPTFTVDFRWDPPAGMPIPALAAEESPQPTLPIERFYLTTWSYNLQDNLLTKKVLHRELNTTEDDLEIDYQWSSKDVGAWGFNLERTTETDTNGNLFRRTDRGNFHPHAFGVPLEHKTCGPSASGPVYCRTTDVTYDTHGNLDSRTFTDGSSESWTHNWCGAVQTHTDAEGRVRTLDYTAGCKLEYESFLGGEASKTYDELQREVTTTYTPNGGSPAVTTTQLYDDVLDTVVDSSFEEPRAARLRDDGHLTLTFMDEWGRPTKQIVCDDDGPGAGDGVLGQVSCKTGTRLVTRWQGWGTDGALMARSAPYFAGGEDEKVVSRFQRDGAGRAIISHLPGNELGANWRVVRTFYGPGYTEVHDTQDGKARVTRSSSTPLSRVVRVAGFERGSSSFDAFGRVTSTTNAEGITTNYTYTPFHEPKTATLQDTTTCIDDMGGSVPCAHERSWDWDGKGRLTGVTAPGGMVVGTVYDDVGRVLERRVNDVPVESNTYVEGTGSAPGSVTVTDEAGNSRTWTFDSLGRPLSSSGLGETETWEYAEAHGLVTRTVDMNGLETHFEYDDYDRLWKETTAAKGTIVQELDGRGRRVAMTDADGVERRFSYTYSGRLAAEELGPWTVEERVWDDAGRLKERRGARTDLFYYDVFDRRTRAEFGVSGTTPSYWVDTAYQSNRPWQITVGPVDGLGSSAVTELEYDVWGRLTHVRNPRGWTAETRYDVDGRVRFTIDEESGQLETRYDDRGRQSYRDLPGAGALTFDYVAGVSYGSLSGLYETTVTDALGYSQRSYQDGLARQVATVALDGSSHELTYDGYQLNRETRFDRLGVDSLIRTYDYDTAGRLESVNGWATQAELDAGAAYFAQHTYTSAGRMKTLTTPEDTTTFTYAHGLLASESFGSLELTVGRGASYPWIETETLKKSGLPAAPARVTTYGRDNAARLEWVEVSASGKTQRNEWLNRTVHGAPLAEVSYVDGLQHIRHDWTYYEMGWPSSRTTHAGGDSKETRWTYLRNGVLAQIDTPSGQTIAYDYGASPFDYQLDRVWDGVGTDYALITSRTARGRAEMVQMAHSGVEQGFDEFGRLVTRDTTSLNATGDTAYTAVFDDFGRLVAKEIEQPSGVETIAYDYDSMGRLTHEYRDDKTITYELDLSGRRDRTLEDYGNGPVEKLSTTWQGTRLTQVRLSGIPRSISYDAWEGVTADQHGNTFDRLADGHISAIHTGAASTDFMRDAQGIPVIINEGSNYRWTSWNLDPGGLPVEVETDEAVLTYIAAEGMLLTTLEDGQLADVFRDSSANVYRIGDEAVDAPTAFGVGTSMAPNSKERLLYGGLTYLPNAPEVMNARHRAYDPQTGRFLRPDPLGLGGGLHRTLYAGGDPVGNGDPMGLLTVTIDGAKVDYTGFSGPTPGSAYIPSAPGMMTEEEYKSHLAAQFAIRVDFVEYMEEMSDPCRTGWCHPFQPSADPPIAVDTLAGTIEPGNDQGSQSSQPAEENTAGTEGKSADNASPGDEGGSTYAGCSLGECRGSAEPERQDSSGDPQQTRPGRQRSGIGPAMESMSEAVNSRVEDAVRAAANPVKTALEGTPAYHLVKGDVAKALLVYFGQLFGNHLLALKAGAAPVLAPVAGAVAVTTEDEERRDYAADWIVEFVSSSAEVTSTSVRLPRWTAKPAAPPQIPPRPEPELPPKVCASCEATPGRHNLEVRTLDIDGKTVEEWREVSGNMTDWEKRLEDTLGGWKGRLGHTEQRLVRRPEAKNGQVWAIEVIGQEPPCSGCRGAMALFTLETGIEIVYRWRGPLSRMAMEPESGKMMKFVGSDDVDQAWSSVYGEGWPMPLP